jgi:hypothetical protein
MHIPTRGPDYYRWGESTHAWSGAVRMHLHHPRTYSNTLLFHPNLPRTDLSYTVPSRETTSTYYGLYQTCTHSTLYSDHVRNAAKGVCTGAYVRGRKRKRLCWDQGSIAFPTLF